MHAHFHAVQGDVWAMDLGTKAWTRLAADAPRKEGVSPGRRVGEWAIYLPLCSPLPGIAFVSSLQERHRA